MKRVLLGRRGGWESDSDIEDGNIDTYFVSVRQGEELPGPLGPAGTVLCLVGE